MVRIIINADDLGLNENVNLEVLDLIKIGVISSSSIITNGSAFDSVRNIALQNPQISYGVHLNLDEFSPLTNHQIFEKYGLIDGNGEFAKHAIFNTRLSNKELIDAIGIEFCSQIEKVMAQDIPISHVDGHHFVHTIEGLFDVIREVCEAYGINRIRLVPVPSLIRLWTRLSKRLSGGGRVSSESYLNHSHPRNNLRKFVLMGSDYFSRKRYCINVKKLYKTTSSFYSYETFFEEHKVFDYSLRTQTVELMCHPGNLFYRRETNLVRNQALRDLIDYTLISYNEL